MHPSHFGPGPFARVWVLSQDNPFGSWQDPASPCESSRALHQHCPREEKENCQAERRERVWSSYRFRLRALPKWSGHLELPMASFQLQTHSNKSTPRKFGGLVCWEYQNAWSLWCTRLWLMLFQQDALRVESEFIHPSADAYTCWSIIIFYSKCYKEHFFLNYYYPFTVDILWGTS